jgi:hypothetical protein
MVSLTELVLFAPLFAWALRRRPTAAARVPRRASRCGWPIVWLIGSTDPVREAVMGRLLREDTAYSSGFSEAAFRTVAIGQSDTDVRTPPRRAPRGGLVLFRRQGDGHRARPRNAHGCR